MKFLLFRQTQLGSSLSLPAHGLGGARATSTLAAHFALQNTRSNPADKSVRQKNFRAKPKQAGKKEGGWGEGIFARLLLSGGGAVSLVGVLLKESSNINQKRPPNCTFCEIVRCCLGASRLGMVFFRNFEGIFEIQKQGAVGNAEVPVRQNRENEVFKTNLFSFASGERLSTFFFDCPKANFKTIWTT
ncbi:MAG: hypothetical protein FJY91_02360 [Candidatus Harrisonbacteria bacterium]|nr:hypothetical protein [Candidatus Harrisonbacteria bacterium]